MPESVFTELRNRKVVRVALVYCAAAFAVLEFSEIAFPRLGLPDSAVDIVLMMVLAGLPVAILLAWFFDATPTQSGDGKQIAWLSPRSIISAAALLAIGVVAGNYLSNGADVAPAQAPAPDVHGASVAVLPFQNISGDEDKGYFSLGLSEDISTALSRFSDLHVIPSRVTYSYRNATDLVQTGRELGTGFVISGSVLSLPRSRRHTRSHEDAVGVCHGEEEATIIFEGVQGRGGGAHPQERQGHRGRGA